MNIKDFLKYDKKTLILMLIEQLVILDKIAEQFGAEFLTEFVGEEEE